jgi:NADPH:quinone reductase-like Zn-dependent oxidoreductase
VGSVAVQMAVARRLTVVASAGASNQDYLRELGARPVRYGAGVADRVRAAAGGPVDAVFDVAGKTPVEDLIALVAAPERVLSIANFAAAGTGIRVTGGGEDSRPMEAMALVADLVGRGVLAVPVRTFVAAESADAYAVALSGHARGKLVLLP